MFTTGGGSVQLYLQDERAPRLEGVHRAKGPPAPPRGAFRSALWPVGAPRRRLVPRAPLEWPASR